MSATIYWRKPTREMPDCGELVLILTNNEEEPVSLGFIDDLDEGWRYQNGALVEPDHKVVGWMPPEDLAELPLA